MKTNNDYLAEYVREKRPEIEESLGFTLWKMIAVLREAISGLTKSMKKVAEQESKLFIDDSCDEECDEECPEDCDGRYDQYYCEQCKANGAGD